MLTICATAAAAEPSGLIAFTGGPTPEEYRVHVLDLADGSITPIGAGRADGPPVWSADGQWIAYASQTDEGRGIRIVRADGSGGRILNHAVPWNTHPRWKATGAGQKIAYVSSAAMEEPRITVYDLDTDEETIWGGERQGLIGPVWLEGRALQTMIGVAKSLDWGDFNIDSFLFDGGSGGMMLATGLRAGARTATTDLMMVTKGGALPLPNLAMPSKGDYVEWSAKPSPRRGRAIAFETNDGGDRELYLLTFTKGALNLSNHRAADWNPVWAPDDKSLAFESFRSGQRGIYRVYPDTTRVMEVAVSKKGDSWNPVWSPDGEWIVFVSNREGSTDLYICDGQGNKLRRLTQAPGVNDAPAWQPAVPKP